MLDLHEKSPTMGAGLVILVHIDMTSGTLHLDPHDLYLLGEPLIPSLHLVKG